MPKAKLNFRGLNIVAKIAKAKQIVTALTGNAEASRILCKRSSVILGWLLFHLKY